MGRVAIDIRWRIRSAFNAAVVLGLLAAALFAAAPTRAATEEGRAPDGEQRHEDQDAKLSAGEQEERSAVKHVLDDDEIELFESFGPHTLHLALFKYHLFGQEYSFPTKFMLLELLAGGLVCAFYIPLARRLSSGAPPAGWRENVREVLLTYIRDEVAKPSIGHDADKYVPFLWTLFLFILFNNLLGLFPFCGSATGNIYVTAGLALCVFFAIHGSAIQKMGFGHYVSSMWPRIDVPFGLGYILKPLIFSLEWLGVLVRNGVLAVRLFANMFAGHVVLATILIFIYTAGHLYRESPVIHWGLWGTVSVMSVLGQVALSLLELFVAFLQAYVFTFLTSIFMGMAMHPAH
jgi:F-type H+-transporting ATPase subunit a